MPFGPEYNSTFGESLDHLNAHNLLCDYVNTVNEEAEPNDFAIDEWAIRCEAIWKKMEEYVKNNG